MQEIKPYFRQMKFLGVIIANVIISHSSVDGSQTSVEYQVKAGFLGNFAKFVHWPKAFLPESRAPYVIGILGVDPFGAIIDHAIEGFTIGGRPVTVKRFDDLSAYEFCHILFISRSQKAYLNDIILTLQQVPTLTVSEMSGFCQKGGMINFILVESNIRFEINPGAAQKAGLKLSSSLLSLARAIY